MADSHKDDNAVIKSFEIIAKKGSDSLDLNRNGIQQIPQGLSALDLSHLKYIYLEANLISSLPDDFFICLQSLVWLDLRNNKLQEIPRNVGGHKHLKTLLLGGNQLRFLPEELGFIRTLTGLNLSNNPLEDPPQTVIDSGVHAIKHYLLAKIGFNPEDFQSDETESDYQSTESGDINSQIDGEEAGTNESKGIGDPKESRDDVKLCGNNKTEGDPTTQSVCSKEALSYYGALLGDIPKSYIFKPWKTGVFFKKEDISGLSPQNFDQENDKGQ